jgi:CBS domain-containing protein
MNVREIMTTDITKATPDNTLVDIAVTMRDEDVGAVPVVEDGQLLGIVTDRDIVVRAIADGREPSATRVEEVLSEEVESVAPDTDVTDAADLMASRQIRRLPVVDDGQLIGMISLGDIAVKHEEGTAAYALEGVSEGVKASSAARSARAAMELRPKGDAESAAAHKTASHKKEGKARRKPSRRAA